MSENCWLKLMEETYGKHPLLELGPGDDGAIWQASPSEFTLVSADMLIEGVHFDRRVHVPELIGRKALAVNLSDMAAMGGVPKIFTVSLGVPSGVSMEELKRIYQGMDALAVEFNVALAGGDTSATNGPLVLSLSIIGETIRRKKILRSGAMVGDMIFVTGSLGGSYHSGRHLTFTPRVREAQFLTERFSVHAMMDLSDGLSGDLRKICSASGKGAVLYADQLPIASDLVLEKASWERALTDGEDFELLFTVSQDEGAELIKTNDLFGVPVTHVGHIQEDRNLVLSRAGNRELLALGGYEHQF